MSEHETRYWLWPGVSGERPVADAVPLYASADAEAQAEGLEKLRQLGDWAGVVVELRVVGEVHRIGKTGKLCVGDA